MNEKNGRISDIYNSHTIIIETILLVLVINNYYGSSYSKKLQENKIIHTSQNATTEATQARQPLS